MMTNLFSIFDPSSFPLGSMNWIIMILFLMIMSPSIWNFSNNWNNLFLLIIKYLNIEFKAILEKMNIPNIIMIISIFIFIFYNNFIGLFPYIFNSTSHMSITLPLALISWMSLNLYGWFNKTKYMLAHLVPQSTPSVLMPFMVLIETTSNIIRPMTLAVRLSANMIAGHLLMTLLGNQLANSSFMLLMPVMLFQIILTSLELAVSIIQAYVFTVLLTLYINEIPTN